MPSRCSSCPHPGVRRTRCSAPKGGSYADRSIGGSWLSCSPDTSTPKARRRRYNEEIVRWSREAGYTLICHTPGTRSNADYTEEGTRQFVASDVILDSILRRERGDPHGLNGFMLLLHIGAGPGRTDKFHRRFDTLLDALAARGYAFVGVDTLLDRRPRGELGRVSSGS